MAVTTRAVHPWSDRAATALHAATPRAWSTAFLVVAVPLAMALLLVQPTGANPDSVAHVARLDQIAHGHLAAPRDAQGGGIARSDACLAGLESHMGQQNLGGYTGRFADTFRAVPCATSRSVAISNGAVNSPVTYGLAVPGWLLGRPLGVTPALSLAVIGQLAAYLAICWWAIRTAPRGQAVLFVVAVLPSSMRSAVGLSSDVVAIALGIVSVSLVLQLRSLAAESGGRPIDASKVRLSLAALGVCLVLAPLAKIVYLPLALLALLVPTAVFRSVGGRWRFATGTVLAAAAVAVAWVVLIAGRIRFVTPATGVDSDLQRQWLREHPLDFFSAMWEGLTAPMFRTWTLPGMVSTFSDRMMMRTAPGVIVALAVVTLVAALVADVAGRARPGAVRDRWLVLGIVVAVIVAAVVMMYVGEALAMTPVPPTWIAWMEGRYFVPLVPLLALPVASFTRSRVAPSRLVAVGVPTASAVILAWYVVEAARLYQ